MSRKRQSESYGKDGMDLPHISVALSAEEWREVIAYLAAAPELQSQIIEQLTDAIGPDYIEELTGSTG